VHVETITLQDVNGNSAEYYWNGRLASNPGGDATHSIDFDALSFDVVDGPPSAAIDDKPAKATDSSSAQFSFSATDPYDDPASLGTSCRVDGESAPCGSGQASVTGLDDGLHSFHLHVTDPRGNGDDASYTWRVDTTAPTVGVRAFPSRFVVSRTVAVSLANADAGTGLASSDVRFKSWGGDGIVSGWHYPSAWQRTTHLRLLSPALHAGRTYCFQTRARDKVGNLSRWSTMRCVTRKAGA
jgi:hypothetical protein